MTMQRQTEIFQAMERPEFYPHPVTAVELRETHISKVFLTGKYVYKIKKPVDLTFLDFTTLAKRRHFCHQEVVLNRRLTHNVYVDVVAVTFEDGRYHLGGPGVPVEYAVKMRQLPGDRSMVQLLRKGKINAKDIAQLARKLAEFYGKASSGEHINTVATWETVRTNCEENFRQTEMFAGKLIDERMFHIIRAATRSFMQRRKPLFQQRIAKGNIRDCHGDLRGEHIYFTDGIQIVDCIEFNERFRYGDVTADLAFLAMDLDFNGFPEIAQSLLDAYVHYTRDRDVFVLLDFYKCYRAFVRVKVNCLRLQEGNLSGSERSVLLEETRKYLDLGYRYAVQFSRPTLWVVCGMPASGKSTIAGEFAKALGITVYRSDVVRKELFGLRPREPKDMPFEQGIYSRGASALTYGRLLLLAQDAIENGNSLILDATYSSRHQRSEVRRLAVDMDVNLIFVECVASDATLKERLKKREKGVSVSDARLHHFEHLKGRYEPLQEIREEMHIRVDTENPQEESMRQILFQDYVLLSKLTAEIVGR